MKSSPLKTINPCLRTRRSERLSENEHPAAQTLKYPTCSCHEAAPTHTQVRPLQAITLFRQRQNPHCVHLLHAAAACRTVSGAAPGSAQLFAGVARISQGPAREAQPLRLDGLHRCARPPTQRRRYGRLRYQRALISFQT